MSVIVEYIINAILIVGAVLLYVAFSPIQRLMAQLPEGSLRGKWSSVRSLILFFIVGYSLFISVHMTNEGEAFYLIVPAVFFLGAVLVLFIGLLAMETAAELKRNIALQHETITDHLMGIYNRRYLDKRIAEEILRARRHKAELSLLLIDIDHFKQVNDHYGHLMGDQVLQSLGQFILKEVRTTDLVARYGGEEIAVICPETAGLSAHELADRLRRKVAETVKVEDAFREKREGITITVSIGVAGFDQEVTDHHCLVARADEALYHAKEGGRNCAVLWNSLSRGEPSL